MTANVPLIDRDREVGELVASLDAALGGSGRVVLLGGEPGIGKTRLASVIAAQAEARGVPVWWGRGWEDGSAPAFWPWNTALRNWIDQAGDDGVKAAVGAGGAELVHVFPVLRDCLSDLPPSETSHSDRARFRLFDMVSRFLAAVARPSGLVVVLDDAHWADASSLKLLEFVTNELADTRVLIVLTYRDTEVARDHPLFDTLSRLTRQSSTQRVLVRGLSAASCARWIAMTGAQGDTDALGSAIFRETNGNPFFVGQIVHLLAAETDRTAPWDVQRVPHGVREVIARRLDRLGADCRTTLAVAALCGEMIDAAIVADILDDPATADRLERAVRDRILVESGTQTGRYGFAHALIRRFLVDELQPSARAAWHAKIASALERHAASSEVVTTELVSHLAAAGTPDALRKAFDYACKGAAQAARGLGWEEAARLDEIALDVGARCGALEPKRALMLRLALARAQRASGNVATARANCEEVMAVCRWTADWQTFARATIIHSGTLPEWGRVEPAVRAMLEEACSAPGVDDALKARLYARLAADIVAANELDEKRVFTLCKEAAAAARRAGDDSALSVALLATYMAAVMELRPSAAGVDLPDPDEALTIAKANGEPEYVSTLRYLRAMMFFAHDDAESFSREVDEVATLAAASRVPEAVWLSHVLAALRATVQGRFAEGQEAMDRALTAGHGARLANAVAVYASQRLMWHVLQGRLAEIGPELDLFVESNSMGYGLRPFRALSRLARGDAAAARAELQTLMVQGLAPAERGVLARGYLMGLAALVAALRDKEHAPMLYDFISKREDVWSIGGGQTLGPWSLLLGALARLCGRTSEAVRHYQTAIQVARRMSSPPIVARAQSQLASLLLTMDPDAEQRERIAAMLDEAAHCAQELGIAHVMTRVERLRTKLAAWVPSSSSEQRVNALRCDGDVWTISFAGRELIVRDGKGPRYLANLLAAPGRELHVLELAGGADASEAAPRAAKSPMAASDGLTIGGLGGDVDDAPDANARREYRARVDELRAELDEAEQYCDVGRAERLRAELDFLVSELAQRFGSRARTRGPAETARKAVTKVLRTQIGKLLDTHPPLGEHLRESVRMGTFCTYAPGTPTTWEVAF